MRTLTQIRSMSLLGAAAMTVAVFAFGAAAPTSAEAHGAYKKRSHGYVAHRSYRKKKRHHRRSHARIWKRDSAIFSHEVDLSRPGGPKRFFELLSEESR
ncbi:MAG: hypothetical protein RIC14_06170 [Filomicrobium sp.]